MLKKIINAGRHGLRPTDAVSARDVHAKLGAIAPPMILDLRSQAEFEAGHIPGATPLPISELGRRLPQLPRDREIVCVCNFGNNSDSVSQLLSAAGFKSINMSDGMIGWQRAGLPTIK